MANVWCPKWVLHISTPLSNGCFVGGHGHRHSLDDGSTPSRCRATTPCWRLSVALPSDAGRLQISQRFPMFFLNEGEHGDQPIKFGGTLVSDEAMW